jgi:transcriptional/translational regulatory protein YebC/TACO1
MALLEAFPGLELEVQEITFLPQASKILSGDDLGSFERLLDMLNDCDDVQEIYHNVALPG